MSQPDHKIRVGITMGDVNGIGPELVLKAFLNQKLKDLCTPILYGSSRVINIYRKVLEINKFHYAVVQNPSQAQAGRLNVIECIPDLERVDIGKPSEIGGKAAYLALKHAIEDAQHQEIDVLVTLPVDKATMQEQNSGFTGHTELLAEAFNVPDNLMMMVSEELKLGLVTNHLPVSEVARNLSVERIVRKVKLMDASLRLDFSIQRPMIALLALNPHAGDKGLIGGEEQGIIAEALAQLQQEEVNVLGPYPADGFFGSLGYRRFDGVMAMYHDQGLIPFKLLAGYEGVNFTAGIPFIRTSPDHGVAYDIAGKGTADPISIHRSIYVGLDVYRNRKLNEELMENALEIQSRPERKRRR
jgi:4-hydroxythreonine-4-phosphate dehydrogenase